MPLRFITGDRLSIGLSYTPARFGDPTIERPRTRDIHSANCHSHDVWKNLKDVQDRVLAGDTDYSRTMPDVWKQEHPEAVREYREEESRYKADQKQHPLSVVCAYPE